MVRRSFSFGNSLVLSAVFRFACQTLAQETTSTASLIKVPGVWEEQASGEFAELDGFVWYRCHELYEKSCAKCHLLFGKGGRIGPDLTSLNRDDSANLLLSIVNPSAEVREGFEQYMVLTDEGRTASGFLFD